MSDDIYLIPVRLGPCDVPGDLDGFQWVDLFKVDGWDKLLAALRERLKRMR
jgi:hypothetical protein